MNINSLLTAELKEKAYRDGYVASQIALGLPNQIRALRTERKWTQGDLATRAKMAQPRISEIETPGERRLNIETLLRLASGFDIGLEVRFVPFSELVDRSEGFDPDSFSVKSFDDEILELEQEPEQQRSPARTRRRFAHRHHSGQRRRVVGSPIATIVSKRPKGPRQTGHESVAALPARGTNNDTVALATGAGNTSAGLSQLLSAGNNYVPDMNYQEHRR
jgi:transcriptional regulator with XRE-family HTH domain